MANGAVLQDLKLSVDLWRSSKYPWVKYYFLTHMHADHTSGLTPSWRNKIYCSEISKQLLLKKFCLTDDLIETLEMGMPRTFDGNGTESFIATFYDANHCPGSIFILFESRFGRVMYTGDFRCDEAFFENFKSINVGIVDKLYLDNTYFGKKTNFPPRAVVAEKILDVIRCHPGFQIIIFCYSLGKEDLLVKIAMEFQEWIIVSQEKYDTLEVLGMPNVFATDLESGRIRAVQQKDLSSREVKSWIESAPTIAIFPTGLFNKENHPYKCNALKETYFFPYSDHSSYSEIVKFLQHLKPSHVIPLVKDNKWDHNEISKITQLGQDQADHREAVLKKQNVIEMEVDNAQNEPINDENMPQHGNEHNVEFQAAGKKKHILKRPRVPLLRKMSSNKGVVFDSTRNSEDGDSVSVTANGPCSKSSKTDTTDNAECFDKCIADVVCDSTINPMVSAAPATEKTVLTTDNPEKEKSESFTVSSRDIAFDNDKGGGNSCSSSSISDEDSKKSDVNEMKDSQNIVLEEKENNCTNADDIIFLDSDETSFNSDREEDANSCKASCTKDPDNHLQNCSTISSKKSQTCEENTNDSFDMDESVSFDAGKSAVAKDCKRSTSIQTVSPYLDKFFRREDGIDLNGILKDFSLLRACLQTNGK